MTYNNYLKQKIIHLYLSKQKIGKQSITENDFQFLDRHFNYEIKENVYSVSELLQNIIKYYESNILLTNKIGLDFLEDLKNSRKAANIFFQPIEFLKIQINSLHIKELEEKYTKIANKYGLKEFYYTLNPKLSSEENYNKAVELLNKTCDELEKIKIQLNIEDTTKIGNQILNIQVNWQADNTNNGYYNYCSNTICLKDENSTFPLIHEYVHFIDKTTTCLLLTGKTSQQLYEEELFSQKELFNNFDMSVFSKIQFNRDTFPWINTLRLKYLFKEEMNQNKYLQEIFNKFDKEKDYKQEFKDIIYNWIEEKQYPNNISLKKDITDILKNKVTQFNFDNSFYSDEEKEIISKTLFFNNFNITQNNSKNWAEELDLLSNKSYYSTQKEMLARSIEQAIQGSLQQLSDRLTTPVLSTQDQKQFFEIIKTWQKTSEEILNIQNKKQISNRIYSLRKTLDKEPNIISQLKLSNKKI